MHPFSPRHARACLGLPFALLTCAGTVFAGPQFTSVTPHPTDLVLGGTAFDGDFEFDQTAAGSPWAFVGLAGIVAEGPTAIPDITVPPVPSGTQCVFVGANAVFGVDPLLSPGIYRIEYQGARAQLDIPGVPDTLPDAVAQPFVRVDSGPLIALGDAEFGAAFSSAVSRPFVVEPGKSYQIGFLYAGSADPSVPTLPALIDDMRVREVDSWTDPSTWRGSPGAGSPGYPQAGDTVTIDGPSVVAIEGDVAASTLTVHGELVVPDVAGSLAADTILVRSEVPMGTSDLDPALLEIGRKSAPFSEEFTITLTGPMPDPSADSPSDKGLVVTNGAALELHGQDVPSWTRLLANIEEDASVLYVDDLSPGAAPTWSVGDEIVVAGSVAQFVGACDAAPFTHQRERRVITNIAEVEKSTLPVPAVVPGVGVPFLFSTDFSGTTVWEITVDSPFEHLHVGTSPESRDVTEVLQDGSGLSETRTLTLDQRAEVGLLSRNIVVTSEFDDLFPGETAFGPYAGSGGHIMIGGTDPAEPAGIAHVSGVELRNLGRSRQVGRYPFHWHLVRDEGFGQYIENSSVVDGFNRAVTIHGVDGARVSDLVCVDCLGHTVFFEDGSEEDNRVERTLVVGTRRPASGVDQTIPTDLNDNDFQSRAPAAFWLANPNNHIVDNVASDTVGSGYWFTFHQTVIGQSLDGVIGHNAGVRPLERPLGSFRGNVAHGCNMGVDINDGLRLTVNVSGLTPEEAAPIVQDTTNYVSRKNLRWLPLDENGDQLPAYLDDTTVYGCKTGVYAGIAPGTVTFRYMRAADNEQSLFLASYDRVIASWFWADSGNGIRAQSDPLLGTPTDLTVEAYRMYDGAGAVIDTRFEGYVDTSNRLIGHNAAANRFLNHRFVRCEHYDDNQPGAIPSLPWVQWTDFVCFLQNGSNCSTEGFGTENCDAVDAGAMKKTRGFGLIVHDVSGTLFDLSGFGKKLVARAPILLMPSSAPGVPLEPLYSNGNDVYESQRRFGLLKLRTPSTTLIQGPSDCSDDTTDQCVFVTEVNVSRVPPMASGPLGTLRLPVFGRSPSAAAYIPIQSFPFQQIPVMAEDDVRTLIRITPPPGQTYLDTDSCLDGFVPPKPLTTPPPHPTSPQCYDEISLALMDLEPDDRTVIGIQDFRPLTQNLPISSVCVFFGDTEIPISEPASGAANLEINGTMSDAAIYDADDDTLYFVIVKDNGVFAADETMILEKRDFVTINWN